MRRRSRQIKPTRVAQRVDAHRSRPDGSTACACSTREGRASQKRGMWCIIRAGRGQPSRPPSPRSGGRPLGSNRTGRLPREQSSAGERLVLPNFSNRIIARWPTAHCTKSTRQTQDFDPRRLVVFRRRHRHRRSIRRQNAFLLTRHARHKHRHYGLRNRPGVRGFPKLETPFGVTSM
jgi:hypothetical protein